MRSTSKPTISVARVPATQYRPDLVPAGIGNGYHGFSFPTPPAVKDGQPHTITVKFAATGANLTWNTPRTINCSGAPPAYQGYHEGADCSTISGWAWDQNDPDMPINVAIYDGPQLLAVINAIVFRQDLANAGIGNGYHGFTLPVSLSDGPHTITVKYSGTSTKLSTTDKSVSCLDGLQGRAKRDWSAIAMRKATSTSHLGS
jgi:hypothetical protein